MKPEEQAEKSIAPILEIAAPALAIVRDPTWQITSDVMKASVLNAVRQSKQWYDSLEAERKAIKGPILDAGRRIDAHFKRVLEPLSAFETRAKTEMLAYDRRCEAVRIEAMQVAAIVPAPPALLVGLSKRTVRKWRIIDEDRVPRQWCSPDAGKINAHLRDGGLEAIAGIEFFDEESLAVR